MADYLRISATFLDPRFHGRGDGGEPEWPPSPLRLMQAIVAANADRIGPDEPLGRALGWLEQQPPPLILAPPCEQGAPYCLSVPNNAMDLVGKAWAKGNYFGTGDSNPATHRTMKTVRPMRMVENEEDDNGDTVHYLWPVDDSATLDIMYALIAAARRMIALGWGIDLVAGDAEGIDADALSALRGQRWSPTPGAAPAVLRIPIAGTLEALQDRHTAFICRMGDEGFVPVSPLTTFQMIGYRRHTDPVGRPCAVFELRHDDGEFCRYSQRKLIHIAGMVRCLAIRIMRKSPPPGVGEDWVERYVAGHRPKDETDHRQLSYLPLPSIGHEHADQIVRRVMIAAPHGDERWLEHVARRLAGQQLIPKRGDEFGDAGPPTLIRVHRDNVARCYTRPANRWASVTPVILPGHDDKKPAKRLKLIRKALHDAGIEQPCELEWSPISCFRKSLPAYKYQKDPQTGEQRWLLENVKQYLQSKTWIHLHLRFNDDLQVPGPIAIGAGRHCGLGILAREPER